VIIVYLKPCPFCGGKAIFHQFAYPETKYCVVCTVCQCGTNGFKFNNEDVDENKRENAEVWNKRYYMPYLE
jgi:Lar family restriction alleviation protein